MAHSFLNSVQAWIGKFTGARAIFRNGGFKPCAENRVNIPKRAHLDCGCSPLVRRSVELRSTRPLWRVGFFKMLMRIVVRRGGSDVVLATKTYLFEVTYRMRGLDSF